MRQHIYYFIISEFATTIFFTYKNAVTAKVALKLYSVLILSKSGNKEYIALYILLKLWCLFILQTEEHMSDHLQTILVKQTENLAKMLARLDFLHQSVSEKDLGSRKVKDLIYGSMAETQFVLCAMQHLFSILSPGYDLPGRYTEDDLEAFELDTLGTSSYIRMFAAYAVVMQHSEIIHVVKADMDNLGRQIQEHTRMR